MSLIITRIAGHYRFRLNHQFLENFVIYTRNIVRNVAKYCARSMWPHEKHCWYKLTYLHITSHGKLNAHADVLLTQQTWLINVSTVFSLQCSLSVKCKNVLNISDGNYWIHAVYKTSPTTKPRDGTFSVHLHQARNRWLYVVLIELVKHSVHPSCVHPTTLPTRGDF